MSQYLTILLIVLLSGLVNSSEKDITVSVGPGHIECFYESVKLGNIIDLEYQVIDGGHGDLDISFQLYEPTNKLIANDYKKSDNYHRYRIPYDGDYRFCFDNTISTINTKIVFFEMLIEDQNNNDSLSHDDLNQDIFEGLTSDEYYQSMVNILINKMKWIML